MPINSHLPPACAPDKRTLYSTARMADGNFLYPTGTIVGVAYDAEVEGVHYFAVSLEGKPAIIVSESKLIDFVL